MKFGLSEYWKPTPKKIRKIADSISAGALAVSSYSFAQNYKEVAFGILALAFIGKFASNLFSEEKDNKASL
jgi:hypothetical protein